MLVQSWLQVPYTEHSSKSVRGEKDKRVVVQRSKGALRHQFGRIDGIGMCKPPGQKAVSGFTLLHHATVICSIRKHFLGGLEKQLSG